jgi:hypothetical protein
VQQDVGQGLRHRLNPEIPGISPRWGFWFF